MNLQIIATVAAKKLTQPDSKSTQYCMTTPNSKHYAKTQVRELRGHTENYYKHI